MQNGGVDPRITTRDQLVSAGVPLHCLKNSQYRGLRPSMLYSDEKLATLKLQRANASLTKLNREEIKVITKQYNEDFKLESVETRTKYESLSDEQTRS